MDKLSITKEKILKAAEEHSVAKDVLKTLFPEVFESKSKYYDFGKEHTIGTSFYHDEKGDSVPLMIAWGLAEPESEMGRYLLINSNFEMKTMKNELGRIYGIRFKKK